VAKICRKARIRQAIYLRWKRKCDHTLARAIAGMPCRARVDGRASIAGVLGDMRRHPHRAQFVDEVLHVIVLVAAERDRPRPVSMRLDQGERRHAFAMPVARVRQAFTRSPERFSIRPWPMKQSLASLPGPLR